MKQLIRRLKNLLKLSKLVVVSADVKNLKFLLSKGLEEKILLKMQNALTDIDQLCQIRLGVI